MFGKSRLFAFTLQQTAIEKKDFKIVILAGVIVSFFTTTFSQAEDMGFFLSVSGFVSQGYKLYVENFEIKDPLFLYSNAIAIKSLGIVGPFYLDFLISAAILPIAYLLAMELTKSTTSSFLAALMFQLTATGEFGQTLRSQIMAILFILLSSYFGLRQKWVYAGIFASAVLFSKMPLLSVIAFILGPLLILDRRVKSALQVTLGFSGFSGFILLVLALRGELGAYFDMVKENFFYASSYQTIVGQSEGFIGHFQVWNGSELRVASFVISILLVFHLAFKKRMMTSRFFILVISTNFGVGFFLINTAMWSHHLQIISLYVFTNSLFILYNVQSNSPGARLIRQTSRIAKLTPSVSVSSLAVSTIVLSLLISNSGASLKSKPEMSLKNWVQPTWTTPEEINMLSRASQIFPRGGRFARLGMNDDMGFGAFLPPEWRFVCKRHAIIGSEPLDEIDIYLNCLRKVPDLILIAPFYENQSNRPGNYQYYFRESQKILSRNFNCFGYNAGYKYCIRT